MCYPQGNIGRIDFVTKKKGHVSFAELHQNIEGFKGDLTMQVESDTASNIVIWTGMSQEAILAVKSLMDDKLICYDSCAPFIYMVDGIIPDYPIATREMHYKNPRWAPVVINLFEGKAQRAMFPTEIKEGPR